MQTISTVNQILKKCEDLKVSHFFILSYLLLNLFYVHPLWSQTTPCQLAQEILEILNSKPVLTINDPIDKRNLLLNNYRELKNKVIKNVSEQI